MNFTKMHGLGNDFIVLESLNKEIENINDIAREVCHRHFGIGADGILLVQNSNIADIKMTIINSDGSLAEMCGNGLRCFCKYVYDKGIVKKETMKVETGAGIMIAKLSFKDGIVETVRVDMGSPILDKEAIPFSGEIDNLKYNIDVKGTTYDASTILMGVPHTAIFVSDIDDYIVVEHGKAIEKMPFFPEGTNVNFVKVIDNNTIEVRTWERGAGYTMACGTGACASAAICMLRKITNTSIKVSLKGGTLNISLENNRVFMEGPAKFICEGKILLNL